MVVNETASDLVVAPSQNLVECFQLQTALNHH